MTESRGETKKPARELILDTAAELFLRQGFRAAGIDTIIERSGVAKMTLYRHFPSKDDLIAVYLKDSDEQFWAWFNASTSPSTGPRALPPRAQLIAFFTALGKLVTAPTCYGCPFLNAVVDFPARNHPGHQVALEHKQAVRARLRTLAQEAGAYAPEVLADQLLLLMDGAFMAVRVFGADNPAAQVATAAEALIAAQLSE